MENNKGQISEYALEFVSTRLDRINKRLTIMLVVAMILIFVSNALWLWAWMQYDYESSTVETTYSQDGQGTNIIGNRNGVQYYVPDLEGDYEEEESDEEE